MTDAATTDIERRVRAALFDMADEAADAPLLQRLERRPVAVSRRRVATVAVAAAVVVALAAAAAVALGRHDRHGIVEPVVRPPKVLRLSDSATTAPGRGLIALVLADHGATNSLQDKPAYVLAAGRSEAVRVRESSSRPTWPEHLSVDGTRLIREVDSTEEAPDWNRNSVHAVPSLEIVDLRTGKADALAPRPGTCPALSPDNTTVAAVGVGKVVLVDVSSDTSRSIGRLPATSTGPGGCGGLGWTPDGRRLVIVTGDGSAVVDRQGHVLTRLPNRRAVNGSMSWSPDGRWLLLYDARDGRYLLHDMDSGRETVAARPAVAVRPLGWAGSRLVWLAGPVGRQRLVTTNQEGTGLRTWTRLDIGPFPIETVSWSTPLRGSAR